jgi:mono/diheme cytochrome c family protein
VVPKSISTLAAVLLLAVVASVPAHADEVDAASAPAAQQAPDDGVPPAEAGKALYAHYCSHCHGFSMVNAGSVSFDLRKFPHDNKARFVESVTNGKNGRMPPWGGVLSSDQLDKLWAYILTGGKS